MTAVNKTLVLDLDGTLVDSVPDLRASLNRLMVAHALTPFSADEVAAMVGDGAAALVRRAFDARERASAASDLEAFLADYGVHAADASRPFAGVLRTLEALRKDGWRLAVCTNKPAAPARALLEALGLQPFFDAVGGGDSFLTRKPDPAHLLATIAAAQGTPQAAIMVGDHRNDIQAALGADIPSIFALWGYGTPAMANGASASAERFSDIPAIADALLRR